MAASAGDYRPLLGGGIWLAGSAALLAGAYGIAGDSYIALALGLEYFLVASAVWVVRSLQRQRDLIARSQSAPPPEALPDAPATTARGEAPLHAAVQTQAIILGGAALLVGVIAIVQLLQQGATVNPVEAGGAALGAICLAGAFVWLVLARSLESIREDDLPEVRSLVFAFREAQWGSLLAAAGLIGATLVPHLALWAGRILLVWVVAICGETLLRLIATVFVPVNTARPALAPVQLLLRQALGTAANPLTTLVRTFEERCGVTLRSSWALLFLKRSALPLLALLVLLAWGMTALA